MDGEEWVDEWREKEGQMEEGGRRKDGRMDGDALPGQEVDTQALTAAVSGKPGGLTRQGRAWSEGMPGVLSGHDVCCCGHDT